ncbi:MAG: gfo/Idh/MocA family oxidoreductase [Clostridiales bacterium]|nr:MAG: gfo/Idh/MocA family oxidoreductase [Clostridiales bacterium]
MKEVGYGIIGCGYFGAELARTIQEFEGAKVVCCQSPGEGARRLSAELHCDREETVEKLLAHPDVDGVIVASPNSMHHEHVLAAARAGKHVYCEKPFALSVQDADEMIDACKKAGVVLMIGHVMHYYEGVRTVKNLISSGAIGTPLCAHAERTGWEPPHDAVSWKKQQKFSGGHLFHHIHEVDLMQWYMGPAKSVFAVGGNLAHKGKGFGDEDDVLLLTIDFANGSFGTMQYGSGFRIGEHFLKINGTLGGVQMSFKDNTLTVYRQDGVETIPMFTDEASAADLSKLFKKTDGGIAYGKPTDKPPAYIAKAVSDELRDFHSVVCGAPVPERVKDLFDGSSARESVAIAAAALRSKESGQPARVE